MAIPYVAGMVVGKVVDHFLAKKRNNAATSGTSSSFSEVLNSSGDNSAQMDDLLSKQQEIFARNMHYSMLSTLEKARHDTAKKVVDNWRA